MLSVTSNQALDLLVDAALIAGFGVQHSILATVRLKRFIQRTTGIDPVSWRGVQSLVNVGYIVAVCALWREVPVVVWDLQGVWFWLSGAILALSWAWYFQIHIFEYDCGMAFGSSAVISRMHGAAPPPMEMWKVGSRRWLRFPVHTAFLPMFFAFPRMTISMLLLGVVANIANLIGTVFYDRRLLYLVKQPYEEYRHRTGLLLPPLLRAPAGAKDLALPAPRHWDNPQDNLAGPVIGLAVGAFYWATLGAAPLSPQAVVWAWGSALVAAPIGGFGIGLTLALRPRLLSLPYARLLTVAATNAALFSAVSLITWGALAFAHQRTLPVLYLHFPMWTTMLWLGHFVSFVTLCGLRPAVTKELSRAPVIDARTMG